MTGQEIYIADMGSRILLQDILDDLLTPAEKKKLPSFPEDDSYHQFDNYGLAAWLCRNHAVLRGMSAAVIIETDSCPLSVHGDPVLCMDGTMAVSYCSVKDAPRTTVQKFLSAVI